jgi:DNA-binding beta-propeller fold protein YncE
VRPRILVLLAFIASLLALGSYPIRAADTSVPHFTLDHNWPKPLPNHWQMGPVDGVFVDSHDLIWVANQSNMLTAYDLALEKGNGDCCNMAPQIIVFDRAGNVVKSWSVSGPAGTCVGYRCLAGVHTIYVDYKGNVWVTGHEKGDSQALKFDSNGKFLLQIGGSQEKGCCGNQDENNLGGGTGVAVWPATNEVFITDGYVNRRVVVYDADTGKFKRMWGAYGHPPPQSTLTTEATKSPYGTTEAGTMVSQEPVRKFDGEGATEWSTVHAVTITPDGIVWIGDRVGNRIQQFHIDGTFIRDIFVDRKSKNFTGTAYSIAFSKAPERKYVYVADGGNKMVHILDHQSLTEVGSFGNCGGQMPGCFNHLHVAVTDSAGNVYTGEAAAGARLQRWNLSK